MRQDNRIFELDFLRGVAIVGVLFLHSAFAGRFSQETLDIQATLAQLFDWAVLAFFFSSGLLCDTTSSLSVTLRKRATSLLLPFILYNALYNLVFVFAGGLGWIRFGGQGSNSFGWFLFRSPGFQLYFLPYLFIISLVVCFVTKLVCAYQRLAYWVILLLVLVFYLVCGYPAFSYGPAWVNIPLYLAAFLIGVVIQPFRGRQFSHPWVLVAGLVGVLSTLLLSRLPILSLAVPPLMFGAIRLVPRVANWRGSLFLGTISGSIYLWHTPILLPASTKLLAVFGVPSLLNFFGSIGLTLGACLIIRFGLDTVFLRVAKRPVPRFITL